jgi:hypothetical protein
MLYDWTPISPSHENGTIFVFLIYLTSVPGISKFAPHFTSRSYTSTPLIAITREWCVLSLCLPFECRIEFEIYLLILFLRMSSPPQILDALLNLASNRPMSFPSHLLPKATPQLLDLYLSSPSYIPDTRLPQNTARTLH